MKGISSAHRVNIKAGNVTLEGELNLPADAHSIVVFAHGSGSSRLSPRNRFVAEVLVDKGFGTLLFDLLTRSEDAVYANRFDIDLLTGRLKAATLWVRSQPDTSALSLGYFGASTGTASALRAAADLSGMIDVVVSRGGRPDLAGDVLSRVSAPVLLIVGGLDDIVIDLNRQAYEQLTSQKKMVIVPGATHLFEEPGKLEKVAELASDWFGRYLKGKVEEPREKRRAVG